jgi:hypothetical protein
MQSRGQGKQYHISLMSSHCGRQCCLPKHQLLESFLRKEAERGEEECVVSMIMQEGASDVGVPIGVSWSLGLEGTSSRTHPYRKQRDLRGRRQNCSQPALSASRKPMLYNLATGVLVIHSSSQGRVRSTLGVPGADSKEVYGSVPILAACSSLFRWKKHEGIRLRRMFANTTI